jgi:hypothetical protein
VPGAEIIVFSIEIYHTALRDANIEDCLTNWERWGINVSFLIAHLGNEQGFDNVDRNKLRPI